MRKSLLSCCALLCLAAFSFAQAPLPDSPAIEQKINAVLSKMTLEQKIDMLGGINGFDIRAFPEFGLPALHMADGPIGVRNDGPATVMAGGISLASTWDPALAQRVGEQLGRDSRAKGKHFLLGPGVNIYRAPLNGRNFEYLGEDPFLGSRVVVGYITGVQSQGVAATIKHYLGNNSEYDRHNTDSVIDDRTLHEIYLPIFEAAVKEAHVAAVMDSYNLVNGQHSTQNGVINNEILKKEFGFAGIIMSDWDATYDAVAAANGGLDLEMPSGKFFNRDKLLPAVKSGLVSEEAINEKVRRILRKEFEFNWENREQQDLSIPRYNQEGRQVALQAAREGMVLLKNDGNVLPLNKEKAKTIAVIGPLAYPAVPVGGGSAQVTAFHPVGFLEGISNYLGPGVNVTYRAGLMTTGEAARKTAFVQSSGPGAVPGLKLELFDNENFSGVPVTVTVQHIDSGAALENPSADDESGMPTRLPSRAQRWTGYYVASASGPVDIFVQLGGWSGGFRMFLDGKPLFDNWGDQKFIITQATLNLTAGPHKVVVEHHNNADKRPTFVHVGIVPPHDWVDPVAEELAAKADAVVVAVGLNPTSETEGWDRMFELPPGQNELIQRLTAKNKNAIVVVTSGGGVDMLPWIDKVPGVIEAWYPGQEGGTALAEILFGDVSPSGHLAATFERRWEDNPVYNSYYPQPGTRRVVYKEGIFVGYRGYEHNGTKPLFPFGYGLSYTTFKYSNLAIKATNPDGFEVTFDLSNTGSRRGATVAQLYVAAEKSPVPRASKELKGFARVELNPGETRQLQMSLPSQRSFAYYDAGKKQWVSPAGTYDVLIGSSSAHIELRDKIDFRGAADENPR